jgi:hypothetical protein
MMGDGFWLFLTMVAILFAPSTCTDPQSRSIAASFVALMDRTR